MNDAVLLQQAFDGIYPPGDYRPMIEIQRARNGKYCNLHGFDYRPLIGVTDEKFSDPFKGAWVKVDMIRRALADGYQYIAWLDADALIKDLQTDLRDAFVNGIGVCWHRIPQLNHWNTGVMYVKNTPEVAEFIDTWLSKFPGERQWMEQGVFNQLALKSEVVQTISDRWNATINYSMVPDAVVLGFHGYGIDAEQRLNAMKAALITIERAEQGAGSREATNG